MTRVGYARVSTHGQDPQLQLDALAAAGCDRVYTDRCTGRLADRPELGNALDYVRAGDALVVWRLDRLGRNLGHLITTVDSLHRRGVEFVSLTEQMDTTTPAGRLLYGLFGAFAEFERELTRERVMAGLNAARAQGRLGGRPRALETRQVRYVKRMHDAGVSIKDLATQLHCGRATVYRALARLG